MAALANTQSLFGGSPSASLDKFPMLRVAFERAAVACTQELRPLAVPPPVLALTAMEAASAVELLAEHESGLAVATLHASGWNTRGLVSANRAAVYTIVEMLLGGDGSQPAFNGKRPLSRIETRITGAFFERLAKALSAAVAPFAATALRIDGLATTVDFDVVGKRSTPMFGARLGLEALGSSGEIIVAVPQAAISAMRQAFAQQAGKDAPRPDPRWAAQIEREVTRANVRLQAVLDERSMTLGEIAGLRVGQVLELKATPKTRVHLECDGQRMVVCQFGRSSGVYTLRVDDFVDREREFMNDILAG